MEAFVKGLSLAQGAWKTVQDKAVGDVIVREAILYKLHNVMIGYQPAVFHVGCNHLPQLGALGHGFAEHITSGNVIDFKMLGKEFGLCAFT